MTHIGEVAWRMAEDMVHTVPLARGAQWAMHAHKGFGVTHKTGPLRKKSLVMLVSLYHKLYEGADSPRGLTVPLIGLRRCLRTPSRDCQTEQQRGRRVPNTHGSLA